MNSNNQKLKPIAALFTAFPAQERTGNEDDLVDIYLMAVDGISPEFVATACQRFIQGLVDRVNMTFRPTPPELAVEARHLRDAYFDRVNGRRAYPMFPPEQKLLPQPESKWPGLTQVLDGSSFLTRQYVRRAWVAGGLQRLWEIMQADGVEAARAELCRTELPEPESDTTPRRWPTCPAISKEELAASRDRIAAATTETCHQ